jgi:hypothetical protein
VTEVRTVAVIGAGTMGRGIAHAAALGGDRTILEDLLRAQRKAETEIRSSLDQAVELGPFNSPEADAVFSHPEYADSIDQAAARCQPSRRDGARTVPVRAIFSSRMPGPCITDVYPRVRDNKCGSQA